MGGGLMQLVAYGAQDIYLTGNPQITFFKVVYRRHTNFSMEDIQQTLNGTASNNGTQTCTISRNGDLVHKVWIEYEDSGENWDYGSVYDVLKNVDCEIGGQLIDRQHNDWNAIWWNLTTPESKVEAVRNNFVSLSGADSSKICYVPLNFWFCRNPGLALPLIALQYHEVKLKIVWGTIANFTPKVWIKYIYLDTDERRRFAQVSHEYLIEQVQRQTFDTNSKKNFKLNFNHPVKELIWTSASGALGSTSACQLGAPAAMTDSWKLKLNGHDRFAERVTPYFSRQQVQDYHTGPGGLESSLTSPTLAGLVNASAVNLQGVSFANTAGTFNDSICVYSFALKPEEHQPSGTCNFSRIDNAELSCTGTFASTSRSSVIYAVNYNVLRIMSGMGGLAYSN